MWFELSADVTKQIEQAEKGNIPIRFYNLKASCYQGIYSCEGDICQSDCEEYQKAFYAVHAECYRKISQKIQEQIGYDRDEAIERCRAKRKYFGQGEENDTNDVGEDAMVLAVKKARAQAKEQEGEKGVNSDHG